MEDLDQSGSLTDDLEKLSVADKGSGDSPAKDVATENVSETANTGKSETPQANIDKEEEGVADDAAPSKTDQTSEEKES